MKKKFVASLLIFSVLFTFILPWLDWGSRYGLALLTTGTIPTQDMMKNMFYVSTVKLYPFFVLTLATPNFGIKVKLRSIAVGVGIYLILDVIMIQIWGVAPFQRPNATLTHIMATNVWEMLGKWVLPFLLWFIFAFKSIEGLLRTKINVSQ